MTITNDYGATNSLPATLTVITLPPVITSSPVSQSVGLGSNATFTVTAAGSQPLSYQWTFNGTNIVYATNNSLVLSNIQLTAAGDYSVTVINPYGTTNSIPLQLTVLTFPPQITYQTTSHSVLSSHSDTLVVSVTGTGPINYQWRYNQVPLLGETNWWLNLNDIRTNQAGIYSVSVSSPYGSTNSADIALTVTISAGYVFFTGGVSASTRVFTNSQSGGVATGYTSTNGGAYFYALFASDTKTNVNGWTNSILGTANLNYAFNDPGWTFVAYGTNRSVAGRYGAMNPDANGYTLVPGIEGGALARFVLIGWSTNIGNNLDDLKNWFNNGSVAFDGWIGQSSIGALLPLGDGGVLPTPGLVVPSFTLGLASPVLNRSYTLTTPALILQATRSGSAIKLSWPTSAGSYAVQVASKPGGPWSDPTPAYSVTQEGTNSVVTVPTANQMQFYRLMIQ